LAIDTAAKRRSAASILPITKAGLIPDGTIGTSDRPAIGWIYNGITFGTATDRLRTAQALNATNRIAKVVFTKSGEDTQTFHQTRMISVEHIEEPYNQKLTLVMTNYDGTFTNLNLKGYQVQMSFGCTTSSGDEYEDRPPLWVIHNPLYSEPGKLFVTIIAYGQPNLLSRDQANANFLPASDDGRTIKDLIGAIAGDSETSILDCYDHCKLWNITWDSEDSLIDSHAPNDGFRIYYRGSRMNSIMRLISRTTNVYRFEDDGEIHIFVPTTTGTSYDAEYSLTAGEHHFIDKQIDRAAPIPNTIIVTSNPDDSDQYSGSANDGVQDPWEIRQYDRMKLTSNDEADDIAAAILSKYTMQSQTGAATVPMDVLAKVWDYIKITDSRENDSITGNIGKLVRRLNTNTGKWEMDIYMGGWTSIIPLWNDFETYPGSNPTEPNFGEVEHIIANQLNHDIVTKEILNVVGIDGTTGRIVVADATDANELTVGINSWATTLLACSKILISGATTLDDWRNGVDATYIDGAKIYTGSITATQIATGTLTANEIAAGAITADEIEALTITATLIKASAIETDKINNGAVTQPKMGFNTEWFGNGDDGDVTIAADTNLTRDMFYNTLTVDATKSLNTKGYRVFVKGKLTNNGAIHNNGTDGATTAGAEGSLGGGGTGGGGVSVHATISSGSGGGGGGVCMIIAKEIDNNGIISADGGNGGDGTANSDGDGQQGSNGSSGNAASPGLGGNGNDGGAAGAGGENGSAGSGASVTNPTAAQGGFKGMPQAMLFHQLDGTLVEGGAGGGGGGAAMDNVAGDGAGGGGGGGGGGVLIILYNEASWNTEQANGGSGGTGASYGSGSGANGSAGSAGLVMKYQIV